MTERVGDCDRGREASQTIENDVGNHKLIADLGPCR